MTLIKYQQNTQQRANHTNENNSPNFAHQPRHFQHSQDNQQSSNHEQANNNSKQSPNNHESTSSNPHNDSNGIATKQKPPAQLTKNAITLEQVKQMTTFIKQKFPTRSVPGLVIAAYDYLRLWSHPIRKQKVLQMMQAEQQMLNQQNYQPYSNSQMPNQQIPNQQIPSQQYPGQQYPSQQFPPQFSNQQFPGQGQYPPMMHGMHQSQAMYPQYPVAAPRGRPRGRGRPPRDGRAPPTSRPRSQPQQQSQSNGERTYEDKTKDQKQKILAQIFLYRGYGIGFAKAEVTFPMDANIYYTYMRTVMFKAFAKLQSIIASECRMQTVQNDDYKLTKFKNELSRCERWMQRTQLKTYQEYIRSVYDLNPQAVSKGDTIRLYRVILSHWEEVKAQMYQVDDTGQSTMAANDANDLKTDG